MFSLEVLLYQFRNFLVKIPFGEKKNKIRELFHESEFKICSCMFQHDINEYLLVMVANICRAIAVFVHLYIIEQTKLLDIH